MGTFIEFNMFLKQKRLPTSREPLKIYLYFLELSIGRHKLFSADLFKHYLVKSV